MARDNWTDNPGLVLAVGLSAAALLAAALWGLSKILPAIGVAVGLGWATAAAGLSAYSAASPWVLPAAGAGLAAAGATLTIRVVHTITQQARKDPLAWLAPTLGLVAAFLVDVCREFYPEAPLVKVMFAGVAGVLVAIGGTLIYKGSFLRIAAGAFAIIGAPAVITLYMLTDRSSQGIGHAAAQVSTTTWLALGGVLGVGGLVGLIGLVAERDD